MAQCRMRRIRMIFCFWLLGESKQLLQEESEGSDILKTIRARLGTLAENRYTNAISRNTISVTSLQSGIGDPPKVNVIPSQAVATLDCRLLSEVSAEDFLAKLHNAIEGLSVRVEVLHYPEPMTPSRTDTELFHTIESVTQRLYHGSITAPLLLPGGTDSRFFRAKGVTAYGFLPFILTPEDLALLHNHNERISLAAFEEGIRLLYEIVKTIS